MRPVCFIHGLEIAEYGFKVTRELGGVLRENERQDACVSISERRSIARVGPLESQEQKMGLGST